VGATKRCFSRAARGGNAVALCMAFVVTSSLACGGDGSSTEEDAGALTGVVDASSAAPAAKFSEIYPLIFPSTTNPRCSFCHSMPAVDSIDGKLSTGADQAAAYAALVGQTSTSSKCGGRPLVVPGQPDMSLFLQKLGPNPPCGSRMPIGGMPLSGEQLEMIRSWIAAGAMND
jgi:hypothetical protein